MIQKLFTYTALVLSISCKVYAAAAVPDDKKKHMTRLQQEVHFRNEEAAADKEAIEITWVAPPDGKPPSVYVPKPMVVEAHDATAPSFGQMMLRKMLQSRAEVTELYGDKIVSLHPSGRIVIRHEKVSSYHFFMPSTYIMTHTPMGIEEFLDMILNK